jgi:hypothetical protein
VWRAALSIPHDDLQPTGPPRLADDAARHQYGLKRRVMRATQPMGEKPRDWIRLLPPTVRRDPRVTVLCERLSTLHDAGAGVERPAAYGGRPPTSSSRRAGRGEASIDDTEGALG